MQDMIIQFIPVTILGLVWAFPVYKTSKKRGVNPWPWTIACCIPIIGAIAVPVFWVTTIMSILDRLNATAPVGAPRG
jgi:hypothetical protein